MSKDKSHLKPFNEDEEKFGTKHKPWNYPDLSTNFQHVQNRNCCSPADELEAMGNDEDHSNAMHSVEVQTEKSAFCLLKQDKRNDSSFKKSGLDNMNPKVYQTNEITNVKLRKTGLNYEHDKIRSKLRTNINSPEVFDEYAETDLDQPMDYTLCYNETNLDDEKKRNASYLHKNNFLCIEETVEEEKVGTNKTKGALNKEPMKNIKKEMFSNTSRSFKEIFNFFKDRDKKRSAENAKLSAENQKSLKSVENSEQKFLKCSQPVQSLVEQCEKELKLKNDQVQCSQPTPLMFSRCSSLGSLNGFEQNSIHDDRSSVVSDFSRRTSGVVSPSELPDSPAQTAPPATKMQPKSQIGCFGKKKIPSPSHDKSKALQNPSSTNDNTLQNDSIIRMLPLAKRSVFEDNLTSFKDESTPTKLYSMTASSLSSLTIDDEDDYEIVNKIILNKEKSNMSNEMKIEHNRQEPLAKTSPVDELVKQEKIETNDDDQLEQEEDLSDEKEDELTDLTPYEEQILDECVRRGIAKWTKRNINEIKPFSWDIGLTCLATRTILNSRIRVNSYSEIDNDIDNITSLKINQTLTNNNFKYESDPQNENKDINYSKKCSNRDINPVEPELNLQESNDQFNENAFCSTYEEHLLDQCIRRGMAKITKRHINDIKPFSWDANQICLTTRAMLSQTIM